MKKHERYPEMYWVVWDDGYTDYFNKTWALEHERVKEDENTTLDTK